MPYSYHDLCVSVGRRRETGWNTPTSAWREQGRHLRLLSEHGRSSPAAARVSGLQACQDTGFDKKHAFRSSPRLRL